MFMDGLQYACVSKNLYSGIGSFWHPVLSQTWYMSGSSNFMEHPPLFYWTESRVFFVFGDSEYSERIFSMILLFLNAFAIHKIWGLVYGSNKETVQKSWLPILMWIITPICFWTFQNNMIEMLVSLFCLLSVYFGYKGLVNESNKLVNLAIAGLCIFLGFLTKGFPALFPVVIGVSFAISSFREKELRKKALLLGLGLFLITLLFFVCLILVNDDAKQSLHFYISQRVLSRVETTPTVDYRATLLYDLFSELIPVFIISVLVYVFGKNSTPNSKLNNKNFLFFLLLGLAGSLPFMLTLVQKKFYFMPSIAFFALAFSCLSVNRIRALSSFLFKNDRRIVSFTVFACVLFLFSVVLSLSSIGKYSRDKEVIEDTNIIGSYLKENTVISTDKPTYYSWSFHFYLLRKFNISLDPNENRSKYFVTNRKKVNDYFKIRYSEIKLPTKEYHLYISTLLDN